MSVACESSGSQRLRLVLRRSRRGQMRGLREDGRILLKKVGVFGRIFTPLETQQPFGSGFCRLVCRRPAILTVQVIR